MLKISVIAAEFPYPPNHGAKVDIWRRLQSFKRCGVSVQLWCWAEEQPSKSCIEKLSEVVDEVHILTYLSGSSGRLQRALSMLDWSLQMTSRIVSQSDRQTFIRKAQDFGSALIWLDGIHGAPLAQDLIRDSVPSRAKSVLPLFYRSHNVEHVYHQRLFQAAKGKRKIHAALCLWHMRDIEHSILRSCRLFFDISLHDLTFWRTKGFINGRYLPPLADLSSLADLSRVSTKTDAVRDFVFLGNLRTDNNVKGILWLIHEVWPKVRQSLSHCRLTIAGSGPTESLQLLCKEHAEVGVELLANPEDASQVYASARVLVNPVSLGSGVSIKSIEMLLHHKPIVTRSQGLAGLDETFHQAFHVADTLDSFALAMVDQYHSPKPSKLSVSEIDRSFGDGCMQQALKEIKENL